MALLRTMEKQMVVFPKNNGEQIGKFLLLLQQIWNKVGLTTDKFQKWWFCYKIGKHDAYY